MEGVITSAPFWAIAAILFAVLNLRESAVGAVAIGATGIPLGGATTCALLYLLHERVFRPVTSRAWPPDRRSAPSRPGVSGRLAMAWTLGTAVPALGVVAVTAAELAAGELDESERWRAALERVIGAIHWRLASDDERP